MRLGVVGMLPADIRNLKSQHLKSVQALNLSSANFHLGGELLFEIKQEQCRRIRQLYADQGMELVQVGIGYGECLFHPEAGVRQRAIEVIARGLEAARHLEAPFALIRTGSLNPSGSYRPARKNHEAESMARLLETLRLVADQAEAQGQTVVIETHVLTILNSPEIIADVVQQVGCEHLRVVMDYVNHFQTLSQVYDSAARINHIFDIMGSLCPVGHCKDIAVRNSIHLCLDEETPGEGELDLAVVLRRWQALNPDGYLLFEHLPLELYPLAAANVHRIAREAGVPITPYGHIL
jgi:sugar phosphate isomerase/epimerase